VFLSHQDPASSPTASKRPKRCSLRLSLVPRHMVRAGLLEPQSPMMEAHVLWQNASAPEPFCTQDEVAVLGTLAGRMGANEVS
jgi:hypothetical protein